MGFNDGDAITMDDLTPDEILQLQEQGLLDSDLSKQQLR